MKKILGLVAVLCALLCAGQASAATELTLSITVPDNGAIVTPETARFNIFNENGEWLANSACDIFKDTRSTTVTFALPEFEAGEVFTVTPTVGITDLVYNDIRYYIDDSITLDTTDTAEFDMTVTPLFIPPTGARTDKLTFSFEVMQTGTPLASTARFNLFDANGEWLANDAIIIKKGGVQQRLTFNLPEYYTGEKFYLCPTVGMTDVSYNGTTYSPEQMIEIQTFDYRNDDGTTFVGDTFYMNLTPLYKLPELSEPDDYGQTAVDFINNSGVGSKTDYLIWVSKSNFKVTVFLGSKGNWQYVKAFDCSIGAPSTPTITGEFEYFMYQPKWTYDTYYVGPVMRFAPKGYAIHSTLIRYNGTPADGRLRMKISHGCVRVAPENIQWLVHYAPIGTRVYITE